MSSPEEQLRDALQADEPAPLDSERIIRSARHRRAMNRARLGAVAAVVVVGGVVGVQAVMQIGQNDAAVTARAPGSSTRAPAPVLPDHASEAPSSAAARPGQPGAELITGRAIVMNGQRWCLVDLRDRTAAQCADLGEHSLRTKDAEGVDWLVAVAASGPQTALLQVEQGRGWVDLRTSSLSASAGRWVGVVPADEVPETVSKLRALDDRGVEVWAAD